MYEQSLTDEYTKQSKSHTLNFTLNPHPCAIGAYNFSTEEITIYLTELYADSLSPLCPHTLEHHLLTTIIHEVLHRTFHLLENENTSLQLHSPLLKKYFP